MPEQKNILDIRDLTVGIETKHGRVTPIDHIRLQIPAGATIGLVGESGCGKSMTALAIMKLLPKKASILSGSIELDGENITALSNKQMRKIRGNRVSMIFQEPMTSLNPVITVGKQVREAVMLHQNVSREEADRLVVDIFRQVGIPDAERRFHCYPHQLSGGLRQRIMIGMAMVCRPDLLIADEPTTALDVTIEAQILYLMKKLRDEKGTSILMITHNLGVVAEICDYVYVMYTGQIVECCSVRELFRNPMHPYTKGLLNAIPSVKNVKKLESIPGFVPSLSDLPTGCRLYERCGEKCEGCQKSCPDLVEVSEGHYVRCFRYGEGISE